VFKTVKNEYHWPNNGFTVTLQSACKNINRTIFARQLVNGWVTVVDKVSNKPKRAIVLPWDRHVLGEWNNLFFFTYEIRNVPFNIQFYIAIYHWPNNGFTVTLQSA
jgi:hypothetical protein